MLEHYKKETYSPDIIERIADKIYDLVVKFLKLLINLWSSIDPRTDELLTRGRARDRFIESQKWS